MSILMMIVLATLFGGVLSMAAAALLVFRLSRQATMTLVAFSAGVMLSAALLDILPEAFALLQPALERPEQAHEAVATLCTGLLAGLLAFFALERLAIWRHAHDTCKTVTGSSDGEVAASLILIGDAFHNFVDGLLIAAAFMTNPLLGISTVLAIVAHEIPQELGDFILLLNAGWGRRKAFLANAASSMTSVIGGLIGYVGLDGAKHFMPYVLIIAAASFIYIAVADLLPLLHRQRGSFVRQSALIGLGIMVVPVIGQWIHPS